MNARFSLTVLLLVLAGTLLYSQDWPDITDRWQARDFYNALYFRGVEADMDWTGSYAGGLPGTISEAWQAATRQRIEFFRNYAGIPGGLTVDSDKSAAAQQAALMMSVRNQISHFPPADWTWYTPAAAEAAQRSNLALGTNGPDAVEGLVNDFGDNNAAVGHRRWFLFPVADVVGIGDVPASIENNASSVAVIWTLPDTWDKPRPATRDPFIAWPPSGYVPAPLVFARWSFSHPGADFSQATVSLSMDGSSIPLVVEPVATGFGDPTLVWVPDGMSTLTRDPWPLPETDETVAVNIDGVSLNGQSRSFSYAVHIFNPDQSGPGEFPTRLSPPVSIPADTLVPIPATTRPWSEGVQARLLETDEEDRFLDAESGLSAFVTDVSAGFQPLQSSRVASGQAAYHLATPDGSNQRLTLDHLYLVQSEDASIQFQSSLAWATEFQAARVDIRSGEGAWANLWEKRGPVDNNSAFEAVDILLGDWAGMVVEIRFSYTFDGLGTYYPNTAPFVGWAFDDLHLSGLARVREIEEREPAMGSNAIDLTLSSGQVALVQVREFAFGGTPLDWGPVVRVEAGGPAGIHKTVGAWVQDPIIGWNYGMDTEWTRSVNLGWVYTSAYPWLYTGAGWFYHISGTLNTGLWLHHPSLGYAYTRLEFGNWFQHDPLTPDSWKPFGP